MATIYGTSANDRMRGTNGDDRFIGSAGADQMWGGDGVDTVSYANGLQNTTGVKVDLSTGTGRWGLAEGDTYFGIENVTGSPRKDWLIGNDGNNTLDGLNGPDVLDGKGGDDFIIATNGDDIVTGGTGADTISLWGKVVVTDFEVGVDVLMLSHHQPLDEWNFSQVGNDTVMTLDGFNPSDIMFTLENVNVDQLLAHAAHDFIFV